MRIECTRAPGQYQHLVANGGSCDVSILLGGAIIWEDCLRSLVDAGVEHGTAS